MSQNSLTFQELPALRKKTEAISQHLQQRLTSYLETLKPLLTPDRFFGKYVGGKADIPGADKAFAQLTQAYKELSGKPPLDLPKEFEHDWLTACGNRIELHRHEYTHVAVDSAASAKSIRISSPVRWVMTYGSAVTPYQVLQAVSGKEHVARESLRQFTVNALVLQLVISRHTGLRDLFSDLRFELKTEFFPEIGQIPFVTITSLLPSFRPSDELILTATEFSGVSAFIELIDASAVTTLDDPLSSAIRKMLG